jgi:hypothetical protein
LGVATDRLCDGDIQHGLRRRLVENGQRLGESGRFVNQQWLWFNAAAMASAIVGGQLVQWLPPATALHTAALIVAAAPAAVLPGTLLLVPEERTRLDAGALRSTPRPRRGFQKRELWIIGLFLFLYYFSPGFATPLYYAVTDSLKFPQGFIGILGSIASAGWTAAHCFILSCSKTCHPNGCSI